MPIQFAQPLWLFAGLIFCLAATFFIRTNIVRRRKSLQQFASVHLLAELTRNVSLSRRRAKNILFILGLICLFTALARPQYGNRWIEVKRKGIDILIGVDVSKSMLARDISPNRLERAKLAIRDFVGKLEGDRVGLLPFAGTSFLMCPLTTDYDAFNSSLDALDINTIPKGGTNIGAAIRQADATLANEANHKIFILVTDGEDLSANALKAAAQAKKDKMTIYTLGVGTPEGELIPLGDAGGNNFVKDREGKFIRSKLDEKTLTAIAEATGGLYVPLGNLGQGFDTIYQQKLALVPREEHDQRKRKVPIERFPWPLGAAALLLGADFLLTGRKNEWSLRLPFIKTSGRRKRQQAAALALLLAIVSTAAVVRASEGEKLFDSGSYGQAMEYYRKQLEQDPHNAVYHFNRGDAAYKNKDYKQAIDEFNETLKTEDLPLQAKSYYNRGNAQFFMGQSAQKTDPDQTIKLWQQALESYKGALALQPADNEAIHNRDLVRKKLDQLKQKQQKKQKKKSDKQDKKKKDKNKKENKKDKNQQGRQGDRQKQQSEDSQKSQGKGSPDQQQKKKQDKEQQGKGQEQKDHKDKQEKRKKESGQKQDAGDRKNQQAAENGKQDGSRSRQDEARQRREQNRQDMERRKQGKMTRQEAKNLLNSLKGEQSELNFIPRGSGNPEQDDEARDW
jgi:Ca-activated chloride channel family protein